VKHCAHTDDTLHTPNVFPLIPESLPPRSTSNQPAPSTQPACIIDPPHQVSPPQSVPNPISPKATNQAHTQTLPTNEHLLFVEKNITFKLPLPVKPPGVKVFSPKYFAVLSKHHKITSLEKKGGKKEKVHVSNETSMAKMRTKEDLLECNR